MRILIIPSVYRKGDITKSGTAYSVAHWAKQWTDYDSSTHVYLMLPDRDDVEWTESYFGLPNDQVTVLECKRFMDIKEMPDARGYSHFEFEAMQQEVDNNFGYFDIVIDQRQIGRGQLSMFLYELFGTQKSQSMPFKVVDYLHDVAAPWKEHSDWWPNRSFSKLQLAGASFADRIWAKGGEDVRCITVGGKDILNRNLLRNMEENTKVIQGGIDFSKYKEKYAEKPQKLHVAGDSGSKKRNPEKVAEISEFLYQRHNIETILSSQRGVPAPFEDKSYVEAYPYCSYGKYLEQLRRGDMFVMLSESDASPITYIEQLASGQVGVLLNAVWMEDQVPSDHELLVNDKKSAMKMASWVVRNWDQAVEFNKNLVDFVEELRGPENTTIKAFEDMESMVNDEIEAYEPGGWGEKEIIEKSAKYVGEDSFTLKQLDNATGKFTDSGSKLSELFTYQKSDIPYCLRAMGYEDTGDSRVPKFAKHSD